MSSEKKTNKALWLESFSSPPSVINLPRPQASPGTVVVQILATSIVPYTKVVHTGGLPILNFELPLVPNPNGVGRVHAVGPDAVRVKVGDLVYMDSTIRGRDNPDVMIMVGHHGGDGPEGRKLMRGEWRDGSLQQYQKIPLENVYPLDEQRLTTCFGYSPEILHSIAHYSVAAGAIIEVGDVKVAETVVIGPSGGSFGGLAVEMALAVGANVIALGRSDEKLAAMKEKLGFPPRLSTVAMTGNDEADTAAILRLTPNGAGADMYSDWTPGGMEQQPYLLPAAKALKRNSRIVLSGGSLGPINIPYALVLHKNIKVLGQWMCERKTLERLIQMIEQGHVKIGAESGTELAVFSLDQHHEAVEHAAAHGAWRNYTVVNPQLS
ncbi:alcohol dehydrogenase [Paramyrothecium foliicola]|nr:alcohol dehydrogenase [Paramyrothecium foliicola]